MTHNIVFIVLVYFCLTKIEKKSSFPLLKMLNKQNLEYTFIRNSKHNFILKLNYDGII